jgi:hypothetical protein
MFPELFLLLRTQVVTFLERRIRRPGAALT